MIPARTLYCKLAKYAAMAAIITAASACSTDSDADESDEQLEWRETNTTWYEAQKAITEADGTPYYQVVIPAWNPEAQVLMHWFNDRSATAGNLSPMLTSTVDTKYKLTLYDGTVIDSSYELADSTYRTKVSSTIQGMQIALQTMHVGDSVRLIVPFAQGYGSTVAGYIPASSTLVFDLKLKDIYRYEIGAN